MAAEVSSPSQSQDGIDWRLLQELRNTSELSGKTLGDTRQDSPLTAATDPPLEKLGRRASQDAFQAVEEFNGNLHFLPKQNTLNINSPAILYAGSRPSTRRTSDWLATTPRAQMVSTPIRAGRTQEMLAELSKLLSETEMDSSMSKAAGEGEIIGPFRLSELSVDYPSRPSIELPPTFSKAPSVKRKQKLHHLTSSQESIFIPATQFPPSRCHSQTTLATPLITNTTIESLNLSSPAQSALKNEPSSALDIPPTQFPPPLVSLSSYQQPDLSPQVNNFSQHIELFQATSPTIFSDKVDLATPETQYSGHEAVILPPSDDEINPFQFSAPSTTTSLPPSAMKKSSGLGGISQKRVQFAPTELDTLPLLISEPLERGEETPFISNRSVSPSSAKSIGMSTPKNPINIALNMEISRENSLNSTPSNVNLNSGPQTLHSPRRIGNIKVTPASSKALATTPKSLTKDSSQIGCVAKQLLELQGTEFIGDLTNETSIESYPVKFRKRPRKVARAKTSDALLGKDFSDTNLVEQMLVWARWRPQYYAPAILKSRASRTRDLWKVNFSHWRGQSHRTKAVSLDHFAPCDFNSLMQGDVVRIVRNRKKNELDKGIFIRWLDGGILLVRREEFADERVELSRIIIDTVLFREIKKKRLNLLSTQPLLHSSTIPMAEAPIANGAASPGPHLVNAKPSSPNSTGSTNPDQLSLVDNGDKKVTKTGQILKGYYFWISLGSLPAGVKRIQKSQIISRICALGGRILDDHETGIKGKKCLLLATGYCRTPKTFLALIHNVPIVYLDWLNACEREGALISPKIFVIAIPGWIADSSDSERAQLLLGWQVALEGTRKFIDSWTVVCRAAGAHIVTGHHKLNPVEKARILVETLPSCTSRLARSALQAGLMIVNVDWLINSIISNVAI